MSDPVASAVPARGLGSALRAAPHLTAFGAVFGLVLVGCAVGTAYIRVQVARSIYHLAQDFSSAKTLGVSIIRESFRHPDILPAFGSSELVRSPSRPFYGPTFFQGAPTGFVLFPVATLGATPLNTLLRVGAQGPELRGKKVVVSFTPSVYVGNADRFNKAFQGNFSPLQANTLALSTDLSPELTQDLAHTLLGHGLTLQNEPLLTAVLAARASGGFLARAQFIALYPLGRLQGALYRLADDYLTYRIVRARKAPRTQQPAPARPVDWNALADSADSVTRAHATNNPFGMDNQYYKLYERYYLSRKGDTDPEAWLEKVNQGYGWPELDLLLRLLKERQAQVLVVFTPQPGVFDDYMGLPGRVRQHLYDRFREAVEPYGFPVETFERFDTDKYFLNDPDSHFSPKGWLHYDRLVDAFYHDSLQ